MQLAVRDGLRKVPQIAAVLEKCQLVSECSQKCTKIADLLDQLNKNIERATLTRWNSEFLMIKSVLSINREDLESITSLMHNPVRFSNGDVAVMKEIIDILEPFYEISLKCQGDNIATASLVVPSIVHIISHLQSFKESLTLCNKLVYQLQSSIEQRFAGIMNRLKLLDVRADDPFNDPLYFMATVLDPAFKLYWIYDLNLPVNLQTQLKHNIIQLIISEIGKGRTTISKEMIVSASEIKSSSITTPPTTLENFERKKRKLFVYDEYLCINRPLNDSGSSDPSKELETYLNDPIAFGFSEYWHRSQLVTLKNLVARLFSVQASSAPIERAFSHASLIFSSRRARLSEELFRELVFLKVNQSLL